jgi:hypothetical protein
MAARGTRAEGASEQAPPSIATHPRAARGIARLKAWAGLLGFALVGLLSWRAGADPFEAGLRALATGIGLYLVAWAAGIALWRQLVLHEMKTEAQRRREMREEMARLAAEQQAAEEAVS